VSGWLNKNTETDGPSYSSIALSLDLQQSTGMAGQEHYYTIHGPRVTEPWLGIRDSSLDVPANRSCVALSIDIQRGLAETTGWGKGWGVAIIYCDGRSWKLRTWSWLFQAPLKPTIGTHT